ncbi:MAG: alpha-amylase family protein, partial [Planctomycetota bacterium]
MNLGFRQIHLDFHTSGLIKDIGRDFDPRRFADTLADAHIDSVTVFARCHHGLLYYPSKANPERVHPHLARPKLLLEQIEACHERGIRVPIYTTVQWDEYTAHEHRDWLLQNEDGELYRTKPLEAGFYRNLDVTHPGYAAFLRDHVREIFETMPVDGLFFDICQPRPSLTEHWIKGMDAAGLDPEREVDRKHYAQLTMDAWANDMTTFIKGLPQYTDDSTIFYNSGHVGPAHRGSHDAFTHYELESLPSGGWGYMHFPVSQRYARGLGKPTVGMTGKFHTAWGDFHSYKNLHALRYECLHMIALGSKCSIGDQLHPRGELDTATYDLIGRVYSEVEAKQPWCDGVIPLAEVGVFTSEEYAAGKAEHAAQAARPTESAMGATRMLQELAMQFDLLSSEAELSKYAVLILPDDIPVDDALAAKLDAYLSGGGRLLASHRSGLTPDGKGFALDAFGLTYGGDAAFEPDFLRPGALRGDLPDTPHVMYQRGLAVEPGPDTEVLGEVEPPYFNRTWRHFCSHRHAPSTGRAVYPGVTQCGHVIYFAHPVFSMYHQRAPRWCKALIDQALRRLGPPRLVELHDAPTGVITSLNDQPAESRYALNLLYFVPERRGTEFDVIEDVVPVYDIGVTVRVPKLIKSATLIPQGEPIEFKLGADAVS